MAPHTFYPPPLRSLARAVSGPNWDLTAKRSCHVPTALLAHSLRGLHHEISMEEAPLGRSRREQAIEAFTHHRGELRQRARVASKLAIDPLV